MFSVRADTGKDQLNGTYHTVGGFVNVGLQLENLLSAESPFTMPEPIFKSPRNLARLLTRKVRRNWHPPTAVLNTRMEIEGLKLFAARSIPDDCITWPQTGGNPLPNVAAYWLQPSPMSLAELQSAKKILVSFTVISNSTSDPGRVGLGDSTTYAQYVDGSPLFPAGSAAVGTHTFELTPGQFATEVDVFIIQIQALSPSGIVCYANAEVQFYR